MKLDNILDMVKKTAISDFGTGKTEKGIKNQTLKKSEKGGNTNCVSFQSGEDGLTLGVEDTKKKSIMENTLLAEPSKTDTQKEYLAVLSNTLSINDFNELSDGGYSVGNTESSEIVTVVDKIKIKLAQAGVNTAFTSDVSLEEIASVVGSTGAAYQVAGNLGEVFQDGMQQEESTTGILEEVPDAASMEFIESGEGSSGFKEFTLTDNGREMSTQEQIEFIARTLVENDLPVTEDNMKGIMETLTRVSELDGLSEPGIKYMLDNQMDVTVENVYRAEYSSAIRQNKKTPQYYTQDNTGYYARKPQDYQWQSIQPQMEKIIEQSGFSVTEDTLEAAKWVVGNGIPLTEENFQTYMELANISLPVNTEDMLKNMIAAMKNGKRPEQTGFEATPDLIEKAVAWQEDMAVISDKAIENVVRSGKEMTLENLKKEQKLVEQNPTATFVYTNTTDDKEVSQNTITARRQLEEIRLKMTAEVSVRMMKQGILVETTELSELVEHLKTEEAGYRQKLFANKGVEYTKENEQLYVDVLEKQNLLKDMPMYALGRVSEILSPSLNDVFTIGQEVQTVLEQAKQSYETMMTTPRQDMGDSIYKAFENVDRMLDGISMEHTTQNERAVKILAFNSMPITKENVMQVKAADQCVNQLMKQMTPDVTIELIRRGKNPLDTDIYRLSDEVKEIKNQMGATSEEKYSEFLFKLEKTNGISQEERNAYIGIYRLFHQIEKSQGSVVGALIHQGAEVTLRNLISSVKTKAHKGTDVKIDDNFGGMGRKDEVGMGMEQQIEAGFSNQNSKQESSSRQNNNQSYSKEEKQQQYYENLITTGLNQLDPEKLSKVRQVNNYNISLENFVNQLEELPESEYTNKELYQETMKQVQQARTVENNVLEMLLDFKQPVTVNHILAADSLMNQRGKMIKELMELSSKSLKKNKEKEIIRAAERVTDQLISKEAAEAAYEELVDVEQNIVEDAMEDMTEYVDVRSLKMLHSQIQLTGGLSKEENYEVPIEIGDEVTSVNLKIIRGTKESGNVSITMNSETYGKVAASFHVKADRITGFMVSDTEKGYTFLRSLDKDIKIAMAGDSYRVTKLNYAKSNQVDLNQFTEIQQAGEKSEVNTKALYQCAKQFIVLIKEKG